MDMGWCRMCQTPIRKLLVWMLLLVLVSVSVSAITVNINGTVNLSTTNGNTPYFNTLDSISNNLTINDSQITFNNLSYTNGELGVLIWGFIPINNLINVTNTSQFPFLNFSDNFTKNISSFYPANLNITADFNVANCTDLAGFKYRSNTSIFEQDIISGFSCVDNRASLFIESIEEAHPTFANILRIVYGEFFTSWELAVIYSLFFTVFHLSYNLNKIKRSYKANETRKN